MELRPAIPGKTTSLAAPIGAASPAATDHVADAAEPVRVAVVERPVSIEPSAPSAPLPRGRAVAPRLTVLRGGRTVHHAITAATGDGSAPALSVEAERPPQPSDEDLSPPHAGSDPPLAHDPPQTPEPPPPRTVAPPKTVESPRPPRVATVASMSLDALSVRGALTSAQVRRALARMTPDLRSCYVAARGTSAVAIAVSFVIDESQRARSIRSSKVSLGGLSACVERVLSGLRAEAAPDVGTVDVSLTIHFSQEAP
jgi:hypothetical protein